MLESGPDFISELKKHLYDILLASRFEKQISSVNMEIKFLKKPSLKYQPLKHNLWSYTEHKFNVKSKGVLFVNPAQWLCNDWRI